MLEFTKEKTSGQLVAQSETTPFKTYWIDEAAWCYLVVTQGTKKGPLVIDVGPYNTLEEAIAAANSMEIDE